jgi:hypothetical protein
MVGSRPEETMHPSDHSLTDRSRHRRDAQLGKRSGAYKYEKRRKELEKKKKKEEKRARKLERSQNGSDDGSDNVLDDVQQQTSEQAEPTGDA